MTHKDFERVVKERFSECQSLMFGSKDGEYTPKELTTDKLNNFKGAAKLQGVLPSTALLGMVAKQITSIYDLNKLLEVGVSATVSNIMPLMREKITDIINYMVLLEAVYQDMDVKGTTSPDKDSLQDSLKEYLSSKGKRVVASPDGKKVRA